MTCVICKEGETRPGEVTLTLERGGLTQVIRKVPASICENCGEEYVDERTVAQLLKPAEEAAGQGVQVEVRRYVAA